jgi:fructan beta-fructosidase
MRRLSLVAVLMIAGAATAAEPDLIVADFEGDNYGEWKTTGRAFGDRPARGALRGQMAVKGYVGKGLVNSYFGGDGATGTLTSPEFMIERDYLNFRIGGGKFDGKTCMNLLLDGQVTRTATGPNDAPGGSEELSPVHWNVKELKGKRVVLQIVDEATGGWGHINVDHIVQSDTKQGTDGKVMPTVDKSIEMKMTSKYLLLPIDNATKPIRMTIEMEGKIIHDFDINLGNAADDFARLEIPNSHDKTLKITAKKAPDTGKPLPIMQSDIETGLRRYDEDLRPQLRFSQYQGWNNDPNGMVYHDGEYHFFWQSNPFGNKWGNMYWGHAVSKDLIHWEELPYALYPRVMAKSHCFSGSANVDVNNTGGWGKNAMIAAFTDTGAGEAIAVSLDKGRSWKYVTDNPVIPKRKDEGRDPKLIWYEPGKHWVIAVYTKTAGKNLCEFYRSTNLKTWEKTGQIEGYYECPELFELPVDGDKAKTKWVVFGANAEYAIGQFDGTTFVPEHQGKHKVHYGAFYAPQCFSRQPEGRVIQVGWAKFDIAGMPFNQAFSLPIELTLRSTANGVRMFAEPIQELQSLRDDQFVQKSSGEIAPGKPLRCAAGGQLLDIAMMIEPGTATEIRIVMGDDTFIYKAAEAMLDGMPLPMIDGKVHIRVVTDRPMYELIGNRGAIYKTAKRKAGGHDIPVVDLHAVGGSAKASLTVHPMRSIWTKR